MGVVVEALRSLKNGNSKLDPVKVVQFLGPVLMFALLGWLFMLGMLETPDQKRARVNSAISREMNSHSRQIGHPVIVERVGGLQEDITDIKETVTRIEAKMSR